MHTPSCMNSLEDSESSGTKGTSSGVCLLTSGGSTLTLLGSRSAPPLLGVWCRIAIFGKYAEMAVRWRKLRYLTKTAAHDIMIASK